jgi:hypothetical protein
MEGSMTKFFFAMIISVLAAATPAHATEITPGNIIGRYRVQASVGFQTIYAKFRVLSTTEFEVQRTYSDGHSDAACNGTYQFSNNVYVLGDGVIARTKMFKGNATCPTDRSKNYDFDIDFSNKSMEDLAHGTNVIVTTSLAPGFHLNAYVKKQ